MLSVSIHLLVSTSPSAPRLPRIRVSSSESCVRLVSELHFQWNNAVRVTGQTICQGGAEQPCYKIAYFRDMSSRVAFWEAQQACEMDGGALLSVESQAEQQLIEQLLQDLSSSSSIAPGPGESDGDFWIGLTRANREPQDYGHFASCPDLYHWTDRSTAQFRNWYSDEPSCGGEACVVMYHQPTALTGPGGAYLYQWNDDRCNMKHNFICKYEPGIRSDQRHKHIFSDSSSFVDAHMCARTRKRKKFGAKPASRKPDISEDELEVKEERPDMDKDHTAHVAVAGASGLLLIYVIIPTIPLLLLILVASGTCCFQMLSK
ncbi:chondrolectin-like, partial [Scleropages formosus]